MLFPDFLTFLANNATIGVVALVAWVAIVGIVVWVGEKAVQKFRQRRSRTPTPADASVSNSVTTLKPATGQRRAQARSEARGSRMTTTPCPICKTDADVLPIPYFDSEAFHCPAHGRSKSAGPQ
jgi:hypothetical protein